MHEIVDGARDRRGHRELDERAHHEPLDQRQREEPGAELRDRVPDAHGSVGCHVDERGPDRHDERVVDAHREHHDGAQVDDGEADDLPRLAQAVEVREEPVVVEKGRVHGELRGGGGETRAFGAPRRRAEVEEVF